MTKSQFSRTRVVGKCEDFGVFYSPQQGAKALPQYSHKSGEKAEKLVLLVLIGFDWLIWPWQALPCLLATGGNFGNHSRVH